MMTDPIADMLTRIRNAVRVERAIVELPSSKVKRGVADVLKREGFIWDLERGGSGPLSLNCKLELKYGPNGERLIRHIRRVSSPGRRVYSRSALLRPVLGGLGISILSDIERRGERSRGPATETGWRSALRTVVIRQLLECSRLMPGEFAVPARC